jgi:ATP-binding cassette, subfamily B, bacterial
MMMPGGPGPIMMRGVSGDRSITKQKIRPGTARRVLPYAKPYRISIICLILTGILDAGIVTATPLFLQIIIDDGIMKHDTKLVVWLAVAVAGLALMDALASFGQRLLSARVGEGIVFSLRSKVFAHVQRQPIAFFTRAQTGALVSRLNTDVVEAQQALSSLLTMVVSSAFSLVFVVITMFYLSWPVTVIALALVPFFIFPTRYIGRRLQRYAREGMQLNAEMGSMMNERFNVAGAMLVKLYGRLDEEAERFRDRAARVRDINVTTSVYGRVFFIVSTLLTSLATAIVYGVGGSLVIGGQIQLGALVALTVLLNRLFAPINQLSNVQLNVLTALVSFDRVFEVLDLKPLVAEREDAQVLETWVREPDPQHPQSTGTATSRGTVTRAPEIKFEDVAFRYPTPSDVSLASLESIALPSLERTDANTTVLEGVSFTAPAGRLTALVGHSGSGKTTITHLVSRLYDPTSGVIRINGRDVRELTLQSLHDTIGVVTQDAHLFHDTIRSNLAYARPGASEEEIIEACRAAQIWDLIASLRHGLDTVVGDRGYRLSGGEKQRVALARLLLKQPSVVILDEATAHLDSESEVAVQRALKTALAGRTSLVIAHRLSTIRDADQILLIDSGAVRECGSHEDLLASNGLYSELYRTQFAGQAASDQGDPVPVAPASRPVDVGR